MSNEPGSDAGTVRISIDVTLEPRRAFDVLVAELGLSLGRVGIAFEPGDAGSVKESGFEAGRVVSWRPGELIRLEWQHPRWAAREETDLEVRFEPIDGGTRVLFEHRGWGGLVADPDELLGWFAAEVVSPVVRAAAPAAFGDWLTDRIARRPSGARARNVYAAPLYHYPNFRVILEELALTRADHLVEVGCGGGAFLEQALRSGCRAAAVDHSADMVSLARATNRDAIADGRLDIREASADRLPFPDATFTCAVMTGVLGFLSDPVGALGEIHRVLRANGRLVMLGSDPELRGTPGAPEPIASRLHFYESAELERLGREAGFDEVRVLRRPLDRYAEEAGVPREHLALFAGAGARFLLARKR